MISYIHFSYYYADKFTWIGADYRSRTHNLILCNAAPADEYIDVKLHLEIRVD